MLDPPYNHCNQAAMTLTYSADRLPFAELPVAMNFPLNQINRRPAAALLREDPVGNRKYLARSLVCGLCWPHVP